MNKAMIYTILGAAIILGFSLIYAALIEQGVLFQPAGSRPKGQVITTPSEHVNLGVIYTESKMLDVSIVEKNNANGEAVELLSLKGISPYDYDSLIIDALKKSVASKNSGYKVQYNMKGSIDNVTLAREGVLLVKTYIKYNSEHQPDYNLNIMVRTYTLPVEEPVKAFTLKKVKRIVENSRRNYDKNMLLVGDNNYKKNRGEE